MGDSTIKSVQQATVQSPVLTALSKNPAPAGIKQVAAATEISDKQVNQDQARDEQKLHEALNKINELVRSQATDLNFSIDQETGKTVIKVVAQETGEVIRQIPSAEMLHIAKALDMLHGLIIRKKA